MKLIFNILIALLFVPSLCFGWGSSMGVQSAASGTSYLLDETFTETTGVGDYGTTWTDDLGTPTHSNAGTVVCDNNQMVLTDDFTTANTLYIGIEITIAALENLADLIFFEAYDSTDAAVSRVFVRAADTVRMVHGTAYTTGTTISTGTYFVWISFSTSGGSGSNEYTIDIGTTGTYSSATSYIDASNGDATTNIDSFRVGQRNSDTGDNVTIRRVIVDDSAIGDFPSE